MQDHLRLVEVALDGRQLVSRGGVLVGGHGTLARGVALGRVLPRVPPRVVAELFGEILQRRRDDAERGAGRVVCVGERDADEAVGVVGVAEVVLVLDCLGKSWGLRKREEEEEGGEQEGDSEREKARLEAKASSIDRFDGKSCVAVFPPFLPPSVSPQLTLSDGPLLLLRPFTLTHLPAPDLGALGDGPADEHEHLADGAALEKAECGEVGAEAQEERVGRGVALPLPQDGDGGEAHWCLRWRRRERGKGNEKEKKRKKKRNEKNEEK